MKREPIKKRISNVIDQRETAPPKLSEDEQLPGQSVSGSGSGKKLSARKAKIMKPRGNFKRAHADPWDA